MHCPFCGADDTKVIDSRLVAEGDQVRRRRECAVCSERFTTYEVAELVMPRVIKQNGNREPFNEEKLRAGFLATGVFRLRRHGWAGWGICERRVRACTTRSPVGT